MPTSSVLPSVPDALELSAAPVALLGEIACSGRGDRRVQAVRALASLRGELVTRTLLRCAESPLGAVRREAVHALARHSALLPDLVRLRAREDSSWIRELLDSAIASRSA